MFHGLAMLWAALSHFLWSDVGKLWNYVRMNEVHVKSI
jgi:hypothetical protein